MRTLLAMALAAVGCASGGGKTADENLGTSVAREGSGAETAWVFRVVNRAEKTVKLSSLEWTDDKGEFKSVGGMAEIAHCCRQGTTTIPPGETVEFERKQKDRPKLRLTYILDGSDQKWTAVVE